jgi:predicted RNase H-like HicB family nuclease
MKFTVILGQEADGGYSIFCPAIPGCASQGDTVDEALLNIREAIELCLEVRAEDGIGLPVETPAVIANEIEGILYDRQEEGLPLIIETREVSLEERVAA